MSCFDFHVIGHTLHQIRQASPKINCKDLSGVSFQGEAGVVAFVSMEKPPGEEGNRVPYRLFVYCQLKFKFA